MRKLNKILF